MDNRSIYVYYVNGNKYCCNRVRQCEWLVKHGFMFIDYFKNYKGAMNWLFAVSPELVDALNQFVLENSQSKSVVYVLGDSHKYLIK